MQRELERQRDRKREGEEAAAQMSKRTRTGSRRVWSCGNRFREGENCKEGFDKKRETQVSSCGILCVWWPICLPQKRQKKGGKPKKALKFRQLAAKASHIQGNKTNKIKEEEKNQKNWKAKDPCHVTPNFTVSKVSENSALDCLSMSFLLAAFV